MMCALSRRLAGGVWLVVECGGTMLSRVRSVSTPDPADHRSRSIDQISAGQTWRDP